MDNAIVHDQLYIQPRSFAGLAGVVAGFSTRHGGVSVAPYDSLNLGLSTRDQEDHVRENRRRLFESVGFTLDDLAITGQVHGDEVQVIDRAGLYVGYDGLVTRQEGLLLCLSAADCASVLLVDPIERVVGACHAGWRGTRARITEKTLALMKAQGAVPANIHGYISPCISLMNFEVGWEVAEQFDSAYVHELPGKKKPHVDLKAALRDQLLAGGVQDERIETSPFCTVKDLEHFYSYRAEAGKTGRLMGFIGLAQG